MLKFVSMLVLMFTVSVANAGAKITVTCESGREMSYQFFDIQEARDFLREECPACVKKVVLEDTDIEGMDD